MLQFILFFSYITSLVPCRVSFIFFLILSCSESYLRFDLLVLPRYPLLSYDLHDLYRRLHHFPVLCLCLSLSLSLLRTCNQPIRMIDRLLLCAFHTSVHALRDVLVIPASSSSFSIFFRSSCCLSSILVPPYPYMLFVRGSPLPMSLYAPQPSIALPVDGLAIPHVSQVTAAAVNDLGGHACTALDLCI